MKNHEKKIYSFESFVRVKNRITYKYGCVFGINHRKRKTKRKNNHLYVTLGAYIFFLQSLDWSAWIRTAIPAKILPKTIIFLWKHSCEIPKRAHKLSSEGSREKNPFSPNFLSPKTTTNLRPHNSLPLNPNFSGPKPPNFSAMPASSSGAHKTPPFLLNFYNFSFYFKAFY